MVSSISSNEPDRELFATTLHKMTPEDWKPLLKLMSTKRFDCNFWFTNLVEKGNDKTPALKVNATQKTILQQDQFNASELCDSLPNIEPAKKLETENPKCNKVESA